MCNELFLFIKLSRKRNRNEGRRRDTLNFFNKKIKRKYFFIVLHSKLPFFDFIVIDFCLLTPMCASSLTNGLFAWLNYDHQERCQKSIKNGSQKEEEKKRKKSLMRKIFHTLCGPENFLSASYHFPFDFPFPKSATQLSPSFVLWLDLHRIHLMPSNWWW